MKLRGRAITIGLALAFAGLAAAPAQAADGKVRIGFLTDMTGPFADSDGPGGLLAMKMAVADFGGKVLGKPVEIVAADHQNKADIAAARAREWIDRDGVAMIVAGTNSAAALAVNKIAADKRRVFMAVGAASDQLINEACTPVSVQYAFNTYAFANTMATAISRSGGKSWFFLTSDFAFGHVLEEGATQVVKANGGTVLGAVRHPLGANDFSSFIMQAQASKAQVLGLANSGGDTINAIKSAREFGLDKKMRLVALSGIINDVHSLGLAQTQGMYITTSWYWDLNDDTRRFAKRYYAQAHKMPNFIQAADYSAVTTWLKAVQAAGTTDAAKVMARLKSARIDDMFVRGGRIRADGALLHNFYLVQVKRPAESKGAWDYYRLVSTIPGEKAYAPLSGSRCALVKK